MNAHESIPQMTVFPPFTAETLPDGKGFGYLKELLTALTGGNRYLAKKLGRFVHSDTLSACLGTDRPLKMDLGELNRLRKFFALAPDFLAGKADMFGQPLKGFFSLRVPAFCMAGDKDVGEYLATELALRDGSLTAAKILTTLLPVPIIPDLEYAQSVLTGTHPLGLMALWELYAELEKQDAVYPPLQELLGVSGVQGWRIWPPELHVQELAKEHVPPLAPVTATEKAVIEQAAPPPVQPPHKAPQPSVAKPLPKAVALPVALATTVCPEPDVMLRGCYRLKARPRHSETVLRRLLDPKRISFRKEVY